MFDLKSYLLKNQFLSTIIIVAFTWLLLQVKDILLLVFISIILVSALTPVVVYLKKKGIPNILSILILYVLMIIFLAVLIVPLVPFVLSQFQSFASDFPRYLNQISQVLHLKSGQNSIASLANSQASSLGQNAFSATTGIFGGFFSLLTVFVVSFYLLLDHENLKQRFSSLFEKKDQEKTLKTLQHIEKTLGAWLRGQLLLSLFVGVLAYISLAVLGLTFALPLALLAGILEIVPILGPILSAVPAVIVAFSISPTLAIAVAVAFLIIQQIENNVLVPKVMEKALGLHPVVVILGVIIGGQLAGILGALLAAPFLSMCMILFHDSKSY